MGHKKPDNGGVEDESTIGSGGKQEDAPKIIETPKGSNNGNGGSSGKGKSK